MLKNDYRYVIEFHSETGKPLGQATLEVDFAPAAEWARLEAWRLGHVAPEAYDGTATLLPRWHPRLSAPYLGGFAVRVGPNGAEETATEFTTQYFRSAVTAVSSVFVKEGKLRDGDKFGYLVAAFPRPEEPQAGSGAEDDAAGIGIAFLPTSEASLSEHEGRASREGEHDSSLPPVFLPARILDEAAALARGADRVETGGILIGHLRRDPRARAVFLEVTAQIPATHAKAELTRLTFTPETWTAVHAAIQLRRSDELMLGWWHSHPVRFWKCGECPVERQRACGIARDFFSEHDRALHRAVFQRAFNIAVVVNDVAYSDPTISVFGWNRGLIEPRGYHVLRERPAAAAATKGAEHAAKPTQ